MRDGNGGATNGGWDEVYISTVLRPGYECRQDRYWDLFFSLQRAHLIALQRAGWVCGDDARRIAAGIARVQASDLREAPYPGDVEDLFFAIEGRLRDEVGEAADNLHLARSRNDIDVTLYRMDLRRAMLDLHARIGTLSRALLDVARAHTESVMPGYTHAQQAQPTTLAHYLHAVLANVERARRRIEAHYPVVNRSPLGAAAFATSGFGIDRSLPAELLGFEGAVRNSYDAVAGTDYLLPFLGECAGIASTLSRFNADLLYWAATEVGAVKVADAFIQVSSIMPNKRNPVVLEHIRSRLGRLPGLAHQAYTLHANVPFGDINDTADNVQPVWWEAVDVLGEAVELLARAVRTLHIDVELLERRAREGFSTVTELADTLVREGGLTFRQAHAVVSRLVDLGRTRGRPPREWDVELLNEAAGAAIGRSLSFDRRALQEALDPGRFVAVRRTMGGPAPGEVAAMLAEEEGVMRAAEAWRRERGERLARAATSLREAVEAL